MKTKINFKTPPGPFSLPEGRQYAQRDEDGGEGNLKRNNLEMQFSHTNKKNTEIEL